MTTVAADFVAKIMAADTYWTDGSECGCVRKVHRSRGALFGFAGNLRDWPLWWAAWKAGKDLPEPDDLTVLRLTRDGLATWTAADGWIATGELRYAIGSGGKCARGAMAFGATPTQAVRIACSIDAGTGGSVRTYRL